MVESAYQRAYDRTQEILDRSQKRVALSQVDSPKSNLPDVCNVLFLAMLRSHGEMDMVANFVEQHVRNLSFAQESELSSPVIFKAFEDIVEENFNPGLLAIPSLVIEAPRLHDLHFPLP